MKSKQLFLVSVLTLFLELTLIRWLGTEVNVFAYLQNTILVVCFLALGIGCWTSQRPVRIIRLTLPLFVLIALLHIPQTRAVLQNISIMLASAGDFVVWNQIVEKSPMRIISSMGTGLLFTFLLMLMVLYQFIPLGRILGKILNEHPKPIVAYSVNIFGSLIGSWIFVLVSSWMLPPLIWFTIVGALVLYFLQFFPNQRLLNFALVLGTIAISAIGVKHPGELEQLWTPYQKIAITKLSEDVKEFSHTVFVNNSGYHSLNKPPEELDYNDPRVLYELPALLHPNPSKSLIFGTGGGNDIAGQLRQGVDSITAVEIDPAVIHFGSKYHQEKPYTSSKVKVVNDDARSFMMTDTNKYDLITFAMLDSHMLSSMTNTRLDHYVYTEESMRWAKNLLKDHGIMVLTFYAKRPFIVSRINKILSKVFSQTPLVFPLPIGGEHPGAAFIVGDIDAAKSQISENPKLDALINKWLKELPFTISENIRPTTDDWPYLYLPSNRVPILFYLLSALVLLLFIVAKFIFKAPALYSDRRREFLHFFFLGAAFMLLEVQNISKASSVFGSTWDVNAIIISGIMVMILLANLFEAKGPRIPTSVIYFALVATCLWLFFLDISQFAVYPYAKKVLAVAFLTCLPIFFSGIIFIRSFESSQHRDAAFGSNLFGSLVGGLLQSLTFIIGIKALLLIVALFYSLAMLSWSPTKIDFKGA